MKKIVLLMLLTACNYGPAPMKCEDCAPLCKPFPVTTCAPAQAAESGRIAYVVCRCGETRP